MTKQIEGLVALDAWIIYFEDATMVPEIFSGDGSENAAWRRYEVLSGNWNCHLFRKVNAESTRSGVVDEAVAVVESWLADFPGTAAGITPGARSDLIYRIANLSAMRRVSKTDGK